MSQDALGQLKHLKTARARWPFPDDDVQTRVSSDHSPEDPEEFLKPIGTQHDNMEFTIRIICLDLRNTEEDVLDHDHDVDIELCWHELTSRSVLSSHSKQNVSRSTEMNKLFRKRKLDTDVGQE